MNSTRMKRFSQIIFPLFILCLGALTLHTMADVGSMEPLFMVGQPVKDINRVTPSSKPTHLAAINDLLFLGTVARGWDEDHMEWYEYGDGIWRSDGTEAGTFKLPGQFLTGKPVTIDGKIFYPGRDGIYETDGFLQHTLVFAKSFTNITNDVVALENNIYFVHTESWHLGVWGELWRYNPESGESSLIFTYIGGVGSEIVIDHLVTSSGFVFFRMGNELWRTDGANTSHIKDICIYDGSYPTLFVDLNDILVFAATDSSSGCELWRSDGTESGTVLVYDILPGEGSSNPVYLTKVGDGLFFNVFDGSTENALWYSDGSSVGTKLIKTFYPDEVTALRLPTEVNGQLYFVLVRGEDEAQQHELWRSDGSEAGTVMIESFGSGSVADMTAVAHELYFSMDGGIWRTAGMPSGAALVKQIDPLGEHTPAELTNLNGSLFFRAYDDIHGWELWRSDGTETGTHMVLDIRHESGSSQAKLITNINEILYLSADDDIIGQELWKSDGTEAGTTVVKDIFPGPDGSDPAHLINHSGTLFFSADDGSSGRELWRSDGTELGTQLVKDIHPTGGANPQYVVSAPSRLYFTADDGVNGRELWQSNGTESGTTLVKDINPVDDSNPEGLLVVNDTVYLTADDGVNGRELWRSDGTETGTYLVKNISPAGSPHYPQNLTASGSSIFFSLWITDTSDVLVNQLWRSDGTESGTAVVESFGNKNAARFVAGDDILYFMLTHSNIVELWRSDGTPGGAWPLITSDPISPTAEGLEFFGSIGVIDPQTNIFYFTFNDGYSGVELFQSDGTPEGTGLVKDINPDLRGGSYPGPVSSWPSDLTVMDDYNRLFFLASGNVWMSNGTEIDTKPIPMLEDALVLTELVPFQDTLVFSAETKDLDQEPWILKFLDYIQFFPRAAAVE